jgi:hypothetical protein
MCMDMNRELAIFLIPTLSMSYGVDFAAGQGAYVFVKKYGTKGSGDAEFNTSHSVAFDAKNNMYITDEENKST